MRKGKIMYSTLKDIAIKYSISSSYISKLDLVEGVHFIFVGTMKRYHINNMHDILTSNVQIVEERNSPLMDKFLLES